MNNNRYALAGCLAFIQIAGNMSMFLFMIFMLATGSRALVLIVIRAMILITMSFIGVYILYTLRRLLNERYDFRGTNTIIPIIAWFGVFIMIFAQFSEIILYMIPRLRIVVIVSQILLCAIPMGILLIVFASSLLRLKEAQNTLLRPYSYTTLVAGVSLLAVISAPFTILILVISNIFLGLYFLSPEPEVEFI